MTAPIAVYGATGYTGKLVVRELMRRGLPHVLSGRNAEKLRRVADELGTDAETRAARTDDPASLRRALDGCAAVVSCAGPFTFLGEPVVRAAIETRTHYVDTTGEQPYMHRLFEAEADAAEDAGVAVVPGMGFDYLPGDLICHLVARGRGPLEELVVAYAVSGFAATRGTLHSALEMMKGGDLVYTAGDWRPASGTGPMRARFAFPEPIGRQAMARYPSGEVVTVPRHVETRQLTSLITTRAFTPIERLAPAVPLVMPGVRLWLRSPLRRVLAAGVDRLPEGPSEEKRANARFHIEVVAHAAGGGLARGRVQGSDVYGLTAVTAVHGAALMAAEGYDRAGVLAPAEAYDAEAFLDALVPHGISWQVDGGVLGDGTSGSTGGAARAARQRGSRKREPSAR